MTHRSLIELAWILACGCADPRAQDAAQDAQTLQTCTATTRDPFTLGQPTVVGHELSVPVATGGGCAAHGFALCWDGSLFDTSPPQVDIALRHDAHGDPCDAWLSTTLHVDLAPVLDKFAPPLIVNITGATGQLEGTTGSVRVSASAPAAPGL